MYTASGLGLGGLRGLGVWGLELIGFSGSGP